MATISKAVVLNIAEYGQEVREYTLRLDKYNYFDAGTFLQMALDEPANGRWPDSRNFSIASSMHEDQTIRLIIRKVGVFTTRVFNELKRGSVCFVKYSFGDFLLPFYDRNNPIVCIAGGTGIAPFLSFSEHLHNTESNNRMFLFYSVKHTDEIIRFNDLKKQIIPEHLYIYVTREPDSGFRDGRIQLTDIISALNGQLKDAHFYICGGEFFTKTFKEQLLQLGVVNVTTDEW